MATDDFPIHEAHLITLFTEAILYGVYLVTFAACMRVLLCGDGTGTKRIINKPFLLVAIVMAVFATLSLALQLKHVMDAFIWYQGPGGPSAELEVLSNWVDTMQGVCYTVQTLIGDLVLIYRCYVVYNRQWLVIALPLLVWVATLACSTIMIYVNSHLEVNGNINVGGLVPWITSLLVLTMVQNLATTSLIAYRIWNIDRSVSQYRSGKTHLPVVRMIIESGAIYTLSLIIFLVLYLCHHNAQYAMSNNVQQIIGIVFNMIIVRVHNHTAANRDVVISTFVPGQPFGLRGKDSTHSVPAESYTMQPVQVNVTRQVVSDTDSDSVTEEGKSASGEHSLPP